MMNKKNSNRNMLNRRRERIQKCGGIFYYQIKHNFTQRNKKKT